MDKNVVYTPEILNSNIFKLEHTVFSVKVRQIDLMDINEIKRFGAITHGDPDDDRKNANSLITVGLTIPKLLGLFRKQVAFYLTNSTDEHLMYHIIYTHLLEWKEYVENAGGIRYKLDRVPYQDLKDLSEMACLLHSVRDRTKDMTSKMNEISNGLFEIDGYNQPVLGDFVEPVIQEDNQERKEDFAPHLLSQSVLDKVFRKRR